jgi:adenylylsulfate kinase
VEVLKSRDVKGHYKKALNGEISNFTGIDDPYEEPLHPEIILDTANQSVEESRQIIIAYLEMKNLIGKC